MHKRAHLRMRRRPAGPPRPRASVPAWLLAGRPRLRARLGRVPGRGRSGAVGGPDRRRGPASVRSGSLPDPPAFPAAAGMSLKNFDTDPAACNVRAAHPHGGPQASVQDCGPVLCHTSHSVLLGEMGPSQPWVRYNRKPLYILGPGSLQAVSAASVYRPSTSDVPAAAGLTGWVGRELGRADGRSFRWSGLLAASGRPRPGACSGRACGRGWPAGGRAGAGARVRGGPVGRRCVIGCVLGEAHF